MELQTVRVELSNGGFAVLFKDVLRKTARLHEAELKKYMVPVETMADGSGKILISELQAGKEPPKKPDYLIDFNEIDPDSVNRIYLLNQVKEWSLGPVDANTVDNLLTDDDYKALVKEMDRLYKPSPLVA